MLKISSNDPGRTGVQEMEEYSKSNTYMSMGLELPQAACQWPQLTHEDNGCFSRETSVCVLQPLPPHRTVFREPKRKKNRVFLPQVCVVFIGGFYTLPLGAETSATHRRSQAAIRRSPSSTSRRDGADRARAERRALLSWLKNWRRCGC